MAINTVILEGLITKEFELKDVAQTQLCTSSLLVGFYDKNEKTSEFYTLEMWGKIGVTAKEKFKKGDICLVQGRLKLKEWTDKTGNLRKEWCIVVSQIDKIKEKAITSAEMPMKKANAEGFKPTKLAEPDTGFSFDNLDLPF